jgi:hypothetical protein
MIKSGLTRIITNRCVRRKVERAADRFDRLLLYLSIIPLINLILLIIIFIL